MVWNKGLKTGIIPRSAFKKGDIPWNKGIKMSKEFCEKISKIQIGKKLSKKHKHKISKALLGKSAWNKGGNMPNGFGKKISEIVKGRKHSEESRKKMSEARKGIIFSEEHKRKLSEVKKGQLSGDKHPMWKGGRIQRNGYILIWQPKHLFCNYAGYVREHRLVAEKILKRYLTKNKVVHHINGIKDDNHPENLYLFISSKHKSYEQLKNKPKLKSNLL